MTQKLLSYNGLGSGIVMEQDTVPKMDQQVQSTNRLLAISLVALDKYPMLDYIKDTMFYSNIHWLAKLSGSAEDNRHMLNSLNLRLDSSFFFYTLEEKSSVTIYEAYKVELSSSTEYSKVGSWKFDEGVSWTYLPLWERRSNLNGKHFRAVTEMVGIIIYDVIL